MPSGPLVRGVAWQIEQARGDWDCRLLLWFGGGNELIITNTGDDVMITSDGKWVGEVMNSEQTPVRWAVLGVPD